MKRVGVDVHAVVAVAFFADVAEFLAPVTLEDRRAEGLLDRPLQQFTDAFRIEFFHGLDQPLQGVFADREIVFQHRPANGSRLCAIHNRFKGHVPVRRSVKV